jgi:(heptosyl)LPS beta-1,4-glucosyltransferase
VSQVSVVIITKNEACNIADCILSARRVSNDIVVVDSGSTDATVLLAGDAGALVRSINWNGYGNARNAGAALAKNNWVLALDADERISNELAVEINTLALQDNRIIYGFKRLNFFGNKKIRFGALAHDRVFRLYHKANCSWNLVPVHEKLVGVNISSITLKGLATHYGIRTANHYQEKKMNYAFLCALKYKQEQKRFVSTLAIFSPLFNFIKSYFFQLGLLDKKPGFTIAKINADYTRKKYQELKTLLQEPRADHHYSRNFLRTSLQKVRSFLS